MTEQPANMKECVSDTIQLLTGHCIPNEMGCVTCDRCDVLMRGSWEESLPFSPSLSVGAVLPLFLTKIHDSLGFHRMCKNVAVGLIGSALHCYQSVTSFGS